jgi:hypothetical protein
MRNTNQGTHDSQEVPWRIVFPRDQAGGYRGSLQALFPVATVLDGSFHALTV